MIEKNTTKTHISSVIKALHRFPISHNSANSQEENTTENYLSAVKEALHRFANDQNNDENLLDVNQKISTEKDLIPRLRMLIIMQLLVTCSCDNPRL